jgi:epoxyqueuosine reductase
MIDSEAVKACARECGADLVGIGSMDRFEGAPAQMDPRHVFPDARAIVALGFRIPRGYLRGIEEGTHFFQYPAMGYANINEVYAPCVIRELCCFLEDHGYEGVAFRNTGGRGPVSDMDGKGPSESPEEFGRRLSHFEPVRPGAPAPDVFIQFRIAGYLCGLGEIGWSKNLLTPEFGPRQRLAFVLTDAPLEPDPIYDGASLCDRCMACVAACPGRAISRERSVRVTLAGREVEWGELEPWSCFLAYMGGVKEINPFLPEDAFDGVPGGREILRGERPPTPAQVMKLQPILRRHYPNACGYNSAMCGGRGCIRACMIHLEQRGVLRNRFKHPFRRRPAWKLPALGAPARGGAARG